MYDFEGTRPEGAPDTPPLPRPPVLLTALEAARVSLEYPASVVLDAVPAFVDAVHDVTRRIPSSDPVAV